MPTIRLARIPTEEMIPVRFTLARGRHAELIDYLTFFNETHGSHVDLKRLLPHLITAFLAADRAFVRWRADHAPHPASRARPRAARAAPPSRPAASS